ncbi:MAG: hypothetical protein AVDCRST_MAG19-4348, partial [uncultured Thermomicrobiales bacterium]
ASDVRSPDDAPGCGAGQRLFRRFSRRRPGRGPLRHRGPACGRSVDRLPVDRPAADRRAADRDRHGPASDGGAGRRPRLRQRRERLRPPAGGAARPTARSGDGEERAGPGPDHAGEPALRGRSDGAAGGAHLRRRRRPGPRRRDPRPPGLRGDQGQLRDDRQVGGGERRSCSPDGGRGAHALQPYVRPRLPDRCQHRQRAADRRGGGLAARDDRGDRPGSDRLRDEALFPDPVRRLRRRVPRLPRRQRLLPLALVDVRHLRLERLDGRPDQRLLHRQPQAARDHPPPRRCRPRGRALRRLPGAARHDRRVPRAGVRVRDGRGDAPAV